MRNASFQWVFLSRKRIISQQCYSNSGICTPSGTKAALQGEQEALSFHDRDCYLRVLLLDTE